MTTVASFTDFRGQEIEIDLLDGSNALQRPGIYTITVNGKMTQKDLHPDAVIRWLGNAMHCHKA